MASEEVLKVVFCFLEDTDLASCMLVCKSCRGVAQDDDFGKCLCVKKWPSILRRPTPPSTTYYMIYSAFNRCKTKTGKGRCYPWKCEDLPPPRLSLDDLDLYIDIWVENQLIFSEVIPGTVLKVGIDMTQSEYCTITIPMESSFGAPLFQTVSTSILVGRNDYNKIACIINRARFIDYHNEYGALGYDYLNFSPTHPFVSGTEAWITLLCGDDENKGVIDICRIEMEFDKAANSEHRILWLLDMLDWK